MAQTGAFAEEVNQKVTGSTPALAENGFFFGFLGEYSLESKGTSVVKYGVPLPYLQVIIEN